MRNFQFSLDRILSWRRKEFEAEESRLAALLAERKKLEDARLEMLASWERAGKELLGSAFVDGGDLAALGGYRVRLEREIEANERQRRDAGGRIASQRARVVEAHRRVRLLEKLRHRQLEQWRVAWNREMENFAGEAFLARWRARTAASGAATEGAGGRRTPPV
jgi:flagellar export protein FliJ